MKRWFILAIYLFCFSYSTYSFADDKIKETPAAIQLKEKGFKNCAFVVDNLTDYVFEGAFSHHSLWNIKDVPNHSVLVTATQVYDEGTALISITATETEAGTCDASFIYIYPSSKSCAQMRDVNFKEWKFYSDVLGLPLYEDPTTGNVHVALEPFKSGCVIIKYGLAFYPKAENQYDADSAVQVDIRDMALAAETYYAEHDSYPGTPGKAETFTPNGFSCDSAPPKSAMHGLCQGGFTKISSGAKIVFTPSKTKTYIITAVIPGGSGKVYIWDSAKGGMQ